MVDDVVQILGGRGLLAGHPVERLYRADRALRIYEGTTEIQQLVIGEQLIRAARREAPPGGVGTAGDGPNQGGRR